MNTKLEEILPGVWCRPGGVEVVTLQPVDQETHRMRVQLHGGPGTHFMVFGACEYPDMQAAEMAARMVVGKVNAAAANVPPLKGGPEEHKYLLGLAIQANAAACLLRIERTSLFDALEALLECFRRHNGQHAWFTESHEVTKANAALAFSRAMEGTE